jgi:hypothetical protein
LRYRVSTAAFGFEDEAKRTAGYMLLVITNPRMAGNEVSAYSLGEVVMALYAGPAGSGGADGRVMRPRPLLRHIKTAMMNTHKNMSTWATLAGIESKKPI